MDTLTTVDANVLQELQSREQFFWLDLDDPDPKEFDALGEILGLQELAVEDTQEFGQRPNADAYGEELLLVLEHVNDRVGQRVNHLIDDGPLVARGLALELLTDQVELTLPAPPRPGS